MKSRNRKPIAITGIGCRFPGGANNPAAFWKLLCDGVDAISEVPADRWNISSYYDPEKGKPGKTYSRWGGFVKDIDKFDPEFFGISFREAEFMDPQQRILLEVAWEAIEDGGHVLDLEGGTDTGVFVGISTIDYANMQTTASDRYPPSAFTATGGAMSIAANRISYCLNFHGPSVAVDTACSSSLVALHQACQSIWKGECGMALAGGVNCLLLPANFAAFSSMSALAADGRCKTFDAKADGFVRSEGAGVIILKPLSDALRDGDRIYAKILATGVNQDGRTSGITMPSKTAQERLVRNTCREAGISPSEVAYVEAHGTGTVVGDPIEAGALGAVLGMNRPEGDECIIGSVKTNIGHLESAAGIAAAIKVALMLYHNMIPPSLHFETPNPAIDFQRLKLRVARTLETFNGVEGKNRKGDADRKVAAVNSFGFGGTNAHTILEAARPSSNNAEKPYPKIAEYEDRGKIFILPLSGRSLEALGGAAEKYVEFLIDKGISSGFTLKDISYAASTRRNHHEYRLSVVGRSIHEIAEGLQAFLKGEQPPEVSTGRPLDNPRPVFVFSGQGPQWWAMGRQLFEQEPVFRNKIEECHRVLKELGEWSLMDELMADEESSRLHETAFAQPAIFSIQVALAALWKSWGVYPSAVIGHSVGEVAAVHEAGILDLKEAMRVIYHRGRCMEQASFRGKMLAVGLSAEDAQKEIAAYGDQVSLAAINGPSSVTLSGDAEVLDELACVFEERSVFNRFVPVRYAFHSAHMDPVKDELLRSIDGLQPSEAAVPIFSTVTGERCSGRAFISEYWWRNVRRTVLFAPAIEKLIETGHEVFLEISAHPALMPSIQQCIKKISDEKGETVLPSLRRKDDELRTMMGTLGALHNLGYPVEWNRLYRNGPGSFVDLPGYAWQRDSYWHESPVSRENRLAPLIHPFLVLKLNTPDPSWEVTLDRRLLPYLNDHSVQGHLVFPGAGYVEMALAAASGIFDAAPYILEEVEFRKALFLPEGEESSVLQIKYSPDDTSFSIHSRLGKSKHMWTLHSVGKMRSGDRETQAVGADMLKIRERCREEMEAETIYELLRESGLQYGPLFQGIKRIWHGEKEALGEIHLPSQLEKEFRNYLVHPALLDSCFQLVFATLSPEGSYEGSFLPVEIARFKFYAKARSRVWGCARLVQDSPKIIEADILLFDEGGNILAEAQGFRCQAVEGARTGTKIRIEDWLYETCWTLKPSSHNKTLPSPNPTASFVPDTGKLAAQLQREAEIDCERLGLKERYQSVEPEIISLRRSYILAAFEKLGWSPQPGQRLSLGVLSEQMGILPKYLQLLRSYLRMLEHDGLLSKTGSESEDEWSVAGDIRSIPDTEGKWKSILMQFPAFYPEHMLIRKFGRELAGILCGETDPLNLLFDSRSHVLEHLYSSSYSYRGPNTIVKNGVSALVEHLPEGRTLNILEIGAGTGGTTAGLLPELPEDQVEYVYTDVSSLFLVKAEDRFQEYSFIDYRVLDIEKDPVDQGFKKHGFDCVIASDVLHATVDLKQTLFHIRMLLAPGGLLILSELDKAFPAVELVFGLVDGWWRFRDFDLRPHSPLLTREKWRDLLIESGFCDVFPVSETDGRTEPGHAVFLAKNPEDACSEQHPYQTEIASEETTSQKLWLLFADRGGVAEELAEMLRARGDRCILVSYGQAYRSISDDYFQVSTLRKGDMQQLFIDILADSDEVCHSVVYFWALDVPAASEKLSVSGLDEAQVLVNQSVIHLCQVLCNRDIIKSAPSLHLITRGAQPVGKTERPVAVAQSPLCGLARVIMSELPELRCQTVDLSPERSLYEISLLYAELLFNEDQEDQVALRGEARYVQRLVHGYLDSGKKDHGRLIPVRHFPCRLESARPGMFENLEVRPIQRRKPRAGEIEIEVCAAGVNFRDVMKALGIYPADAEDALLFGDECSGRVSAVGEGVTEFKPGDPVIAIAPGCFGPYVTTIAPMVTHLPKGISMEEGSSILVTYLTAYYALYHLAQLRKGERVLIHAGAGGVGLSAIQLAQYAGAEVFATAGSPEKRAFLQSMGVRHVMDSRSLSFAEEIIKITAGEGVDIVLNSLAGEAIPKSLSLLRPYGRFLEIGKRDIYGNSKIGLKPFKNNISFFAIDLSRMLHRERIGTLIKDVRSLFEKGNLRPLPYRAFSLGDAVRAFRHIAQAKQIGKIVLTIQDERIVPAKAQDFSPLRLRADSAYLVTGGLRGFGLSVAQWLVQKGARYLVLAGRSGVSSEEAREAVQQMQEQGVKVVASSLDVGSEKDLAGLLAEIRKTMPPLRGVLHSAAVFKDCMLLQMDPETFRSVMAPKAYGAWNLHVQTRDLPLDFFVLFSSVASVIGNPGQGNYVAANAFLEALAHHRRSLGLPGLTIAWDRIKEVGYVARNEELGEHITRMGWTGLSPADAHLAIERLIVNNATQMTVSTCDWAKWASSSRTIASSPRYSVLTHSEGGNQVGEEAQQIRQKLYSAEPPMRRQILEDFLREQIAKVVRTSPSKLDPEKPLNYQGLDSLMAVELLSRIETQLGVGLPTGQLMDAPSITKLTGVMLEILMGGNGGGPQSGGHKDGSEALPVQTDGVDTDNLGDSFNPEYDIRLGDEINIEASAFDLQQVEDPNALMLTGSSGFLGAHMIRELLLRTKADIYCLVRGSNESEARSRILANLEKYSLTISPSDLESRIRIVLGDIEQPALGLSRDLFDMLADKVDSIYHIAADVNHIGTYSQLRSANVLGSLEILKLAVARRLKAVHYASTFAVFGFNGASEGRVIRETDKPDSVMDLSGGYGQSKWVAERILESARDRGLPVSIYRPGFIIGEGRTGISSSEDLIWRFVKTCIGLGIGPDSQIDLYLTPVNFVAGAMAYLSLLGSSMNKVFHLVNPHVKTARDILVYANSIGYEIELLPSKKWGDKIQALSDKPETNPLLPFVVFYPDKKKMELGNFLKSPTFDLENVDKGLEDSTIVCPAVDDQLLGLYFDYFIRTGFFPAPSNYKSPAYS